MYEKRCLTCVSVINAFIINMWFINWQVAYVNYTVTQRTQHVEQTTVQLAFYDQIYCLFKDILSLFKFIRWFNLMGYTELKVTWNLAWKKKMKYGNIYNKKKKLYTKHLMLNTFKMFIFCIEVKSVHREACLTLHAGNCILYHETNTEPNLQSTLCLLTLAYQWGKYFV